MTLAEQIEALDGPSREMDVKIFKFFNPQYSSDDWQLYAGGLRHKNDSSDCRTIPNVMPSKYSTSVDAALSLVPDGWELANVHFNVCRVNIRNKSKSVFDEGAVIRSKSNTVPLAICAAAIRAIEEG